MRSPSPISAVPSCPARQVGGFAPWPPRSPQPPATARTVLCLICSLLFVASLIVACSAINVVSSWPAHSEMYRSPMEPAAVCSVKSMECVEMARPGGRNWNLFGAAGAARILERLPIPDTGEPFDPAAEKRAKLAKADLSELQMFAMMQMSEDRRHQAIWYHARRFIFEADTFTGAAFFQLRDKGFAIKRDGAKYHSLSPAGAEIADIVADELAKKHAIHAMYIRHRRDDSMHSTFFCTCGYRKQLVIGGNMQLKAEKHFYNHLASVRTVNDMADAVALVPRVDSPDEG